MPVSGCDLQQPVRGSQKFKGTFFRAGEDFFLVDEVDDGQGLLLACWWNSVKGELERIQQKESAPICLGIPGPWVSRKDCPDYPSPPHPIARGG